MELEIDSRSTWGGKTVGFVIVITDHDSVDYPAVAEAADLIFDTRNAIGRAGIEDPKVVRL